MTILAIFKYSDESEHAVPFSRSPRGLQKTIIDDDGSRRERPIAVHFQGELDRSQLKSVKICNSYRTWLWHCIDQVKRKDMIDDIDEPNKQSIWDISSGKLPPKDFFDILNHFIKIKEIRRTSFKDTVTLVLEQHILNILTPLEIQWGISGVYPLPSPPPEKWYSARMPNDWNRVARFKSFIEDNWCLGTLIGMDSTCGMYIRNDGRQFSFCEVKEE